MVYNIKLHRHRDSKSSLVLRNKIKKVKNGQKITFFSSGKRNNGLNKFCFTILSFMYIYISIQKKRSTTAQFLKGHPSPPGSFRPKRRGGGLIHGIYYKWSRFVLMSELIVAYLSLSYSTISLISLYGRTMWNSSLLIPQSLITGCLSCTTQYFTFYWIIRGTINVITKLNWR